MAQFRLKPDYAEAYNNRGVAKRKLGQYEAAVADYDEAIRLKPDFAEAYSNRGHTKQKLARISNLIQTSRPSGGLERLYS